MKTHSYSTHPAILLVTAWLFFNALAAGQVMGADRRPAHAVVQPAKAPARLIIRRNPNLGFNVIARLWIDGQPAGSIGYGHTFDGFLAPGHHVLAVLASPSSRPLLPGLLLMDQRGDTSIFTTTVGHAAGYFIASG